MSRLEAGNMNTDRRGKGTGSRMGMMVFIPLTAKSQVRVSDWAMNSSKGTKPGSGITLSPQPCVRRQLGGCW